MRMKPAYRLLFFILLFFGLFEGCRKEDPAQIERSKTGEHLVEQEDGSLIILGTKELYHYRQLYWLKLTASGEFINGNQFGEVGQSIPLAFEVNRSGSYGLLVENEREEQKPFSYRYTICDSAGVPYDYLLLSALPDHNGWSYKPASMVQNDNYTHLIGGSCQKNGTTYPLTIYIHENGTYYESKVYDFSENLTILDMTKGAGEANLAVGLSDSGSLWIMSLTHKGDTIWTRQHHYEKAIYPRKIEVTGDGNIHIAGHYDQVGQNSFISCFTATGEFIRTKYYNGSVPEQKAIITTENNETYCVLNHGGFSDLLRMDEEGNTLWSESISNDLGGSIRINSLIQTKSNELLMLGNKTAPHGVSYIYLAKFDAEGNQLWQKTW